MTHFLPRQPGPGRPPALKETSLDPDRTKLDPFHGDYTPPALGAELRQLGIFPTIAGIQGRPVRFESDEKAIHIQTRVPPSVLYAIDRVVEQRLFLLKSRQDVFRTALVNFVLGLADSIQEGEVRLSVRRLERQRARLAEIRRLLAIDEMVETTRKAARLLLQAGAVMEAIHALRDAKRFMEDIPLESVKEQFASKLDGREAGVDGTPGTPDEVGQLWRRVLEGELDRDDEELVTEQARIY